MASPQPATDTKAMGVGLPDTPSTNRAQDTYEKLRAALRGIEVFPAQMAVDWGADPDAEPHIRIGNLSLVDVLRIVRTLERGRHA